LPFLPITQNFTVKHGTCSGYLNLPLFVHRSKARFEPVSNLVPGRFCFGVEHDRLGSLNTAGCFQTSRTHDLPESLLVGTKQRKALLDPIENSRNLPAPVGRAEINLQWPWPELIIEVLNARKAPP